MSSILAILKYNIDRRSSWFQRMRLNKSFYYSIIHEMSEEYMSRLQTRSNTEEVIQYNGKGVIMKRNQSHTSKNLKIWWDFDCLFWFTLFPVWFIEKFTIVFLSFVLSPFFNYTCTCEQKIVFFRRLIRNKRIPNQTINVFCFWYILCAIHFTFDWIFH